MNGTQNQQHPNPQAAQQAALRQKALSELKKKKLYKRIAIAAASLLVLAVLFLAYTTLFAKNGVKRSQYQAVFLSNGQVYFGKLDNPNDRYLTLKDVYYLQVQNNQQKDENQQNQQQLQGEPQLIKLGEELHGPEDEMKILQTQVTFWENLKNDSKVVKAIEAYQKK